MTEMHVGHKTWIIHYFSFFIENFFWSLSSNILISVFFFFKFRLSWSKNTSWTISFGKLQDPWEHIFRKPGGKHIFFLLENVVCYSWSNICEIKAQIDHCPGEAQPFLVLKPNRNYSQDCRKEDTVGGNDVLPGVSTTDVTASFVQQSTDSLMRSYQMWFSKGSFQGTLECGSGIWLSIELARC